MHKPLPADPDSYLINLYDKHIERIIYMIENGYSHKAIEVKIATVQNWALFLISL